MEDWYLPLAAFVAVLAATTSFRRIATSCERAAIDRLDQWVSAASALFWEVDTAKGTFLSVTGDVDNLIGQSAPSLIGSSVFDLMHQRDTK